MSIEITNLKKSFSKKPLFFIEELTLQTGFTIIRGPSGCGKTTLGRIIAGIEPYDSGKVNGASGNPTILFQESRLLPSVSALDNINVVCRSKKYTVTAKKLLNQLGFNDEDMKKRPSELSGGMMRRVAIVRAIVFALERGGNFVLLDEPFTGLDPETRSTAASIIYEHLNNKHVLVITHDEDDTSLLNGRSIVFSDFAK